VLKAPPAVQLVPPYSSVAVCTPDEPGAPLVPPAANPAV